MGDIENTPDEEYDLYDGMPPSEPVDTSVAAAVDVLPHINRQQAMVLNYIRVHGPATDDELEVALHLSPSTCRPRRRELVLRYVLRDSGQRRLTRHNRKAIVWELGESAIEVEGGTTLAELPTKDELRAALDGLRDLYRARLNMHLPIKNKAELDIIGRWLSVIAK